MKGKKKYFFLFFICLIPNIIFAQGYSERSNINDLSILKDSTTNSCQTKKQSIHNRNKYLWFSLQFGLRFPQNDITIGYTASGKSVGISPKGDLAYGVTLGYTTRINIDYSLTAFFSNSELIPAVENANASFNRSYISPVIKYIYESRSKQLNVNFGLGMLITNQPILDIDVSQLPDGAHYQFIYKNAFGGIFQFEIQNGPAAFHGVLLKLYINYSVLYFNLKTAMIDGINWPLDLLPTETYSLFSKLNSNVFEVGLAFGYRISLTKKKK